MFSGSPDSELRRLRLEKEHEGVELSYVRFPRLYGLLRWNVSDQDLDFWRGQRLAKISYLVAGLVFLQMAVNEISDGLLWWSPDWGIACGALFSLAVLILYWEPYRTCRVPLLSMALAIQIGFYFSLSLVGVVAVFLLWGESSWGIVGSLLISVVSLWCWRARRVYERDLLRGQH